MIFLQSVFCSDQAEYWKQKFLAQEKPKPRFKKLEFNFPPCRNLDLIKYWQFFLGSYAPLLQEKENLFRTFDDFLCQKIEQEIITVDNVNV